MLQADDTLLLFMLFRQRLLFCAGQMVILVGIILFLHNIWRLLQYFNFLCSVSDGREI